MSYIAIDNIVMFKNLNLNIVIALALEPINLILAKLIVGGPRYPTHAPPPRTDANSRQWIHTLIYYTNQVVCIFITIALKWFLWFCKANFSTQYLLKIFIISIFGVIWVKIMHHYIPSPRYQITQPFLPHMRTQKPSKTPNNTN